MGRKNSKKQSRQKAKKKKTETASPGKVLKGTSISPVQEWAL